MNKKQLDSALEQLDARYIDEAVAAEGSPAVQRRRRRERFMSSPWTRLTAACFGVVILLTAAVVLPGIAEHYRGDTPGGGHNTPGAQVSEDTSSIEPIHNDIGWCYDIDPQEAWDAVVATTQLTEEQLQLGTRELVDAIVKSDYFKMVAMFSSNTYMKVTAYALWSSDLNGLRELETREDAAEVLCAAYAEYHPNGYRADQPLYFEADVVLLSILFSEPYVSSLTEEQAEFLGGVPIRAGE